MNDDDYDTLILAIQAILYTVAMIFLVSVLYAHFLGPDAEFVMRTKTICEGDVCLTEMVARGYIRELFDGGCDYEGFDQKFLNKFRTSSDIKERFDEYEAVASNKKLKASCKDNICMKTFDNSSEAVIIMLRNFYNDTMKVLPPQDPRTQRLASFKINDSKIFEVDPRNEEDLTSFTINKGERMGMCLRQADGSIVDNEDVKFVFLHELAHIATLSHGHKPDFWANFKWMLTIVYANNLMVPKNYSSRPASYCKIKITHNPYFDD